MAKPKAKTRDIGLDIKAPSEACNNEKCPWHGHLKVRGRIFKGQVVSAKTFNTAIVEWHYYQRSQKYERYERRKSRKVAYNPHCINAHEGDKVTIGECRPLSKTKRFVVLEKLVV